MRNEQFQVMCEHVVMIIIMMIMMTLQNK